MFVFFSENLIMSKVKRHSADYDEVRQRCHWWSAWLIILMSAHWDKSDCNLIREISRLIIF